MLSAIFNGVVEVLKSDGLPGEIARKVVRKAVVAGAKNLAKGDVTLGLGKMFSSGSSSSSRPAVSSGSKLNSFSQDVSKATLPQLCPSKNQTIEREEDPSLTAAEREELESLSASQVEIRGQIREASEAELHKIGDRIESLRCKVVDNGMLNSLAETVRQRLDDIDRELRTVGTILCSSREEAARSKEAQPLVDDICATYAAFASGIPSTFAQDMVRPCFMTEYGQPARKKILDRARSYVSLRTDQLLGRGEKSVPELESFRNELVSLDEALGRREFGLFSQRIANELAIIDEQLRTVDGRVCATREEAEILRREIPLVDSVVNGKPLYPFEAVEGLLAEIKAKKFVSDYAKEAIRKIEKLKAYMLTVDGVVYSSWDEAEKAFQAACGGVAKFFAYQLAYGNKKGSRALLAAKHWPGSLPPNSVMARFNAGDLAGAASRLGSVAVPGIVESCADTFGSIKGFFKMKS